MRQPRTSAVHHNAAGLQQLPQTSANAARAFGAARSADAAAFMQQSQTGKSTHPARIAIQGERASGRRRALDSAIAAPNAPLVRNGAAPTSMEQKKYQHRDSVSSTCPSVVITTGGGTSARAIAQTHTEHAPSHRQRERRRAHALTGGSDATQVCGRRTPNAACTLRQQRAPFQGERLL